MRFLVSPVSLDRNPRCCWGLERICEMEFGGAVACNSSRNRSCSPTSLSLPHDEFYESGLFFLFLFLFLSLRTIIWLVSVRVPALSFVTESVSSFPICFSPQSRDLFVWLLIGSRVGVLLWSPVSSYPTIESPCQQSREESIEWRGFLHCYNFFWEANRTSIFKKKRKEKKKRATTLLEIEFPSWLGSACCARTTRKRRR